VLVPAVVRVREAITELTDLYPRCSGLDSHRDETLGCLDHRAAPQDVCRGQLLVHQLAHPRTAHPEITVPYRRPWGSGDQRSESTDVAVLRGTDAITLSQGVAQCQVLQFACLLGPLPPVGRKVVNAQHAGHFRLSRVATQVNPAELRAAMLTLALWLTDDSLPQPDRAAIASAVRLSARTLAQTAPGNNVEVRVPPFVAVQCVAGPRHTRGTPPNVVETDPRTWLLLVAGRLSFTEALERALLHASGTRAEDIAHWLPLLRV